MVLAHPEVRAHPKRGKINNPTQLPLSCVHMPLSALHPPPRDLLPCPCPLQPHEGLSLQQVAKEGLEKWPQGQGEEEG